MLASMSPKFRVLDATIIDERSMHASWRQRVAEKSEASVFCPTVESRQ